MKGKYDFYDIVKIVSDKPKLQEINGKIGVITGVSTPEDSSRSYAYAVDILNSMGEPEDGWFVHEEDLQTTGKKADRSTFEAIESIKVRVDPKTGESHIVED